MAAEAITDRAGSQITDRSGSLITTRGVVIEIVPGSMQPIGISYVPSVSIIGALHKIEEGIAGG